jgi:hypothetical protein
VEIGTVIVTEDSPSPSKFSFVVTEDKQKIPIRQGQFVEVVTEEGKVMAFVTNLVKTNQYFMRAESVREYERGGKPLMAIFPTNRWEYLIAEAQTLGVQGEDGLERVAFPPSPGQKVHDAGIGDLIRFLGLSPNGGIELGKLKHHELSVGLDITKLLRKHVAILGMSGSGKSFGTHVMIEELLDRPPELGRVGIIVMDVHGEYTGLSETPAYSHRVRVLKGKELKIGVPNMTPYQFMEFLPEMSGMQARELQWALERLRVKMRAGGGPFGLEEVISQVEGDDDVHKHLRQALVGWLHDLQGLEIFDRADNPNWEHAVEPGKVVVVNLSDLTSLRKKQMLVTYAARRLFNARKRNRVPPFVLCLEEAHQFCPSTEAKRTAISRGAIETLAREGRKFYASLVLISQRPVRLSTTVLSQAGTNVILRVTNPYDLEHIRQSSEAISKEVADMISSLPVGEALVVGEAVNHPIFVRIRRRRSRERVYEAGLEEAAKEFERLVDQRREDAGAFM